MVSKPHLIVGLVSLTSLAFVLRMVRRRQLRAKYSLLWVCVGVGMLFIAIAPGVLDRVAHAMGIDYPPAVYLLVAVAFLLVVVVHFSWELSRLEEKTRTLAEELALLRAGVPAPGTTGTAGER